MGLGLEARFSEPSRRQTPKRRRRVASAKTRLVYFYTEKRKKFARLNVVKRLLVAKFSLLPPSSHYRQSGFEV
jgi:hypothetical protein